MDWICDSVSNVLMSGEMVDSTNGCWPVCNCRKAFSCSCHKVNI